MVSTLAISLFCLFQQAYFNLISFNFADGGFIRGFKWNIAWDAPYQPYADRFDQNVHSRHESLLDNYYFKHYPTKQAKSLPFLWRF